MNVVHGLRFVRLLADYTHPWLHSSAPTGAKEILNGVALPGCKGDLGDLMVPVVSLALNHRLLAAKPAGFIIFYQQPQPPRTRSHCFNS
jgi:hypothetical protein